MPVYEYNALNKKGREISGFIDAGDIKSAKLKLRGTGIFPSSMKELDAPSDELRSKKRRFSLSGISGAETAIITRQLATLIEAEFPLVNALNTMLPQIKKPSIKRIISKIKDAIEEGSSFATALAQYPGVFSNVYINMVRAGEASGTLGIVLERLADIAEARNKMNRKIQSALAYPFLMTLIAIGVLFFLLTVIVPNITSIFDEMNQSLPWTTQMLINISAFLKQWWWLILALFALFFMAFQLARKQRAFKIKWDKLTLSLPVLGTLIQKIAIARVTRTLGSLLENGVSLLDALEIVKKVTGNLVIEDHLKAVRIEVEQGRNLGDALSRADYFPYFSVQMIKVGEKTGKLEKMLKKTADIYDEEVETSIVGLTSLIEPVIILIMAVMVGFVVLSICLPIFDMNRLVS